MYTKPNHDGQPLRNDTTAKCPSRLAIMATPVAKQLETVRLKRAKTMWRFPKSMEIPLL